MQPVNTMSLNNYKAIADCHIAGLREVVVQTTSRAQKFKMMWWQLLPAPKASNPSNTTLVGPAGGRTTTWVTPTLSSSATRSHAGVCLLVKAPEPVELNADLVWITTLGLDHGAKFIDVAPQGIDTVHLGGPDHLGKSFVGHERCPAIAVSSGRAGGSPDCSPDPDRRVRQLHRGWVVDDPSGCKSIPRQLELVVVVHMPDDGNGLFEEIVTILECTAEG